MNDDNHLGIAFFVLIAVIFVVGAVGLMITMPHEEKTKQSKVNACATIANTDERIRCIKAVK